VTKFEAVRRQRFVGFSDKKRFDYIYLEFSGVVPMYCGRKKIREMNAEIRIHEDKVDPVLKFCQLDRYYSGRW